MSLSIYFLFFLFSYQSLLPNVAGIMKNGQLKKVNLVLYDEVGGEGARMDYEDEGPWFDHMPSARFRGRLSGIEWICVETGVFILYKDYDYVANSPDDVHIFSGQDKCSIPPPPRVGSIRHSSIKFVSAEETPHLSLFSELYYGGWLYSIIYHSNRGIAGVAPVQSLMTVGNKIWTVYLANGTVFCLRPHVESPTDVNVCLIPNLAEFLNVGQDSPLLKWRSVGGTGCEDPRPQDIYINTCFDYFSGEIQGSAVSPMLPSTAKPPAKNETSGEVITEDPNSGKEEGGITKPTGMFCEETDDFAFLLRMRIAHNFSTIFQFLVPLNKKHSWRTELLDLTFDVGISALSPIMESFRFLPQMREILIFYMEKKIWSQGKGWPEKKPSREINAVVRETKACLESFEGSPVAQTIWTQLKDNIPMNAHLPEALFKEGTYQQPFDKLDIGMEILYRIFLITSASCHKTNQFKTNYWLEFNQIFYDMYLEPMAEHWKNPGDLGKWYKILFGGDNLEMQFRRVDASKNLVYGIYRSYEIQPRPEDVQTALM